MNYFHEDTPAPPGTNDDTMFDLDIPQEEEGGSSNQTQVKDQNSNFGHRSVTTLTSAQERRLRDYLEEEFIQLQRNLTRRSLYPDLLDRERQNPLEQVSAFLSTISKLAHVILYANASAMQTEHFLRLTGEFLTGLKEYRHPPLTQVLDLLDAEFDSGWAALLDGHRVMARKNGRLVVEEDPSSGFCSVTQTQRIRLRALVKEWQDAVFELSRPRMTPAPRQATEYSDGGVGDDDDEEDGDFEPVVVPDPAREEEPVQGHGGSVVVFPKTLKRLAPS